MDKNQLKIMEEIVSAVKKTGVDVDYIPNKTLKLTFQAKEDYGDSHAPSEISITGHQIENLHAMSPTLIPSMIACSFPYQDKQAFMKDGLSGLTGSGVEITPAIKRLLEKSWDQMTSQCSKAEKAALAAVAPYERSEKKVPHSALTFGQLHKIMNLFKEQGITAKVGVLATGKYFLRTDFTAIVPTDDKPMRLTDTQSVAIPGTLSALVKYFEEGQHSREHFETTLSQKTGMKPDAKAIQTAYQVSSEARGKAVSSITDYLKTEIKKEAEKRHTRTR